MQVNLNTNLVDGLFSGTYDNPFWEVSEWDDDGNEIPCDYDFNELMQTIVDAYQNHAKYIVSEMGVCFIKDLKFTGSYSPREYNHATDCLDFTLNIDKRKMINVLASLEGNTEFSKFLKDNYTSYDGFWSFTPNNYNELKSEILGNHQYFYQSLGALITFLMLQYQKATGRNITIEIDVAENWQGNGYGGLDYKPSL